MPVVRPSELTFEAAITDKTKAIIAHFVKQEINRILGPLRSVADKLTGVLAAEGLVAFGAAGDEFDPELHEAVQHDGTGANPVIGSVYRCGYRLGEKVIRTAMVTVTDPAPAGDAPGAQ